MFQEARICMIYETVIFNRNRYMAIVDTVRVPRVPAGKYVIRWRWDAEQVCVARLPPPPPVAPPAAPPPSPPPSPAAAAAAIATVATTGLLSAAAAGPHLSSVRVLLASC